MTSNTLVLIRRWFTPPALVLLGYALLAVFIFWVDAPVIRVLLAAVVVLFGPGYSLVAILFRGITGPDLVERLALGAGLSLAIGGMLGFVLALSPWGLTLIPLLTAAALFNLICYAIIVMRSTAPTSQSGLENMKSHRNPIIGIAVVEQSRLSTVIQHREFRSLRRVYSRSTETLDNNLLTKFVRYMTSQGAGSLALTVVLVAAITLGGYMLSQAAITPSNDSPMTEFFLLDDNGLAQSYPTLVRPQVPPVIHFGIINHEGRTTTYRVEAVVAEETIGRSSVIILPSGEIHEAELPLRWPENGVATTPGPHQVEFILYRDVQPYRSLHLWLELDRPAESEAASGPLLIQVNDRGGDN